VLKRAEALTYGARRHDASARAYGGWLIEVIATLHGRVSDGDRVELDGARYVFEGVRTEILKRYPGAGHEVVNGL
jgi:hypothetical protein